MANKPAPETNVKATIPMLSNDGTAMSGAAIEAVLREGVVYSGSLEQRGLNNGGDQPK